MSAEQQVAQRFVMFLVESISSEVGQMESPGNVLQHCTELRKAVETLFSEGSAGVSRRRNGS